MDKGNNMKNALEILSIMLSKNLFNKEKIDKIYRDRKLVYEGDKSTIDKVINVYGNLIK